MVEFPSPSQKITDFCAVPLTDLIEAYRGSIDLLRKELKAEIEAHKRIEKADPNFGDDIFLLRFVLSYHKKSGGGGLSKAKSKLLKMMEWRAKYHDILLPLRKDLIDAPFDAMIRPYMASGLHYCTDDGFPVFIIRSGLCNPHATMEGLEKYFKQQKANGEAKAAVEPDDAADDDEEDDGFKTPEDSDDDEDEEEDRKRQEQKKKDEKKAKKMTKQQFAAEKLSDWLVLTKESAHAYCDAHTRKLNRLIKIVVVQDCKNVALSSFNRNFVNAIAASAHVSEGVYPQLLKRSVMVNLPALCRISAQLVIKLMPQGLQDKVGICPETDPSKVAIYISNNFNIPMCNLPTFLGGECKCAPMSADGKTAAAKNPNDDGSGFCCGNALNSIRQLLPPSTAEDFPVVSWKQSCEQRLGQPYVSKKNGLKWPCAIPDGYLCSFDLIDSDKKEKQDSSSPSPSSGWLQNGEGGLSPSSSVNRSPPCVSVGAEEDGPILGDATLVVE